MLFLCGVWFLLGHLCRVSRRPEATFCKGSRIMRAPLTYKYPDSSFFQLFMHTNCIYISTFIHGFYRSVNPWDPRDLCSRCVNAPALFSTAAMSLARNVPVAPRVTCVSSPSHLILFTEVLSAACILVQFQRDFQLGSGDSRISLHSW